MNVVAAPDRCSSGARSWRGSSRRWPRLARGAAGSSWSKGRPGSARRRCWRRRGRRRQTAACACCGRGEPSWSATSPSESCASSSSRRWPRRRSSSAPICCRRAAGVAAGLLGLPGASAADGRALVGRRSLVRDPPRPLLAVREPRRRGPALPRRRRRALGGRRRRSATSPSCSRGSRSSTSRWLSRPARARRAPMPSCSRP